MTSSPEVTVRGLRLTPLFAAALLTCPASAQFPELTSLQPRGFQRGTTVELKLGGRSLESARGLLFDTEGITLESLKTEGGVSAQLSISEDCPLGLHSLRVRTATGLTNLRTFSVGALLEVSEAEPNGTPQEAQEISLGSTVNGVAQDEDLDL